MDYKAMYEQWLDNPYFDEETKAELKAIAGDEKEIEDRFYMDLEFGTAGLRGVIGAGTNRMNIYTVRKATQGLANYIISVGGEGKGVAIAFDSRHMSPEFADEAALCLAANGIKAYVFESLRPTPELSYAVRRLGCIAGINITASHNPPEYNGYKVYWEDGAQITPPHDTGIMDEVKKVTDYATVKTMDKCLEDGCDKMLIVLTQPEGFIKTPRKSEKNMAKIMKLKYPVIAEELLKRCDKYNESVRLCEKLEKTGKAVILRPKYKLNSLESDTGKLRQTYEMGKEIAKENMDKIKFLCEK